MPQITRALKRVRDIANSFEEKLVIAIFMAICGVLLLGGTAILALGCYWVVASLKEGLQEANAAVTGLIFALPGWRLWHLLRFPIELIIVVLIAISTANVVADLISSRNVRAAKVQQAAKEKQQRGAQ